MNHQLEQRLEKRTATKKRVAWVNTRFNNCGCCMGRVVIDDRRYIDFSGGGRVIVKCGHRCGQVVSEISVSRAVKKWNRAN